MEDLRACAHGTLQETTRGREHGQTVKLRFYKQQHAPTKIAQITHEILIGQAYCSYPTDL